MRPEPPALLGFLRHGVARLYADSLLQGTETALASIRPLESRAREEGLLLGDPREIALRALTGSSWNHANRDALLADRIFASLLPVLIPLQAKHDAAFIAGLNRLLEPRRALTAPIGSFEGAAELRRLVEQWAAKFGADGLDKATVTKPYLDAAIVGPGNAVGRKRALEAPGLYDLNPYLEFHDREDAKVRPNHHFLHLFVARTNWVGWERYCLPPLGWNCRCRIRAITWFEAKSRGMQGDFPGTSLDKFKAFMDAGGPDPGFPRELFVVGAAA